MFIRLAAAAALLFSLTLTAVAEPPVPRVADDFKVVQPDGKVTTISSLKGKVVVIQFLSTICPHCQNFSGKLAQMQQDLGPKGFQAVGIAFIEASPEQTAQYASRFAGNAFPIGYASQDAAMGYLRYSPVQRIGVPQIMVIDKEGIVRAQTRGMPDGSIQLGIDDLVQKLLAE